ncbi:alpha-2-macroglobulin family protein [Ekhidna sp.]|uniref:alpha-2-macroglobulin family protein n=1 Tax=Ekhidna sp. TaxID=2608089 RepID=UPI003BA8AC94
MKKLFIVLLGTLFLITSCQKTQETQVSQDARFMDYVVGFTTGIISKKDNITIQFANDVVFPQEVSDSWISISPSVKGEVVRSGQSLVFSPSIPLKSGQEYAVKLSLSSMVEVPEALKEFVFKVQTIPMDFEVDYEGLRTTDNENPKVLELNGELSTSDFVANEEVEKMINAGGKKVEWVHRTSTSHRFTVKNIERTDDGYDLKVAVSGQTIGVEKKDEETLSIPSTKNFSLTSTSVQKTGTPYVSLLFSDPLQPNQNLKGLITIDGEPNPKFVIDGNQVQVYLTRMLAGSRPIKIESGVKNVFGHPLQETLNRYLAFDPENPKVRLIGKGSILPSTDGLVLPFEAINLKSVQVDVIQVFEQNIPQFLQANSINGSNQMLRTGRHIMSKSIDLSEYSNDLSNWNRFTLDIASLFETEKGAIYQVQLGFGPEDSVFPCEDIPTGSIKSTPNDSWSIYDNDGFNNYYSNYYYPRGYRWNERDNPCHISYYHSDRFATRNLIASDIGLITKIGGDNSLNVYATNMISASPVEASVKVLDFQLQLLDEAKTDANGMVTFNPVRRPFLIIAEANNQKSYLKLDDGSSLTMSNFDVSGNRVRNGIKGFIYGERGVWRPGNDIFLSFMLEDTDDRVPADQPVIFELRDPQGNLKDRQVANASVENLYSFITKTDPTDITGNWNATIKVGNASFNKQVKVETIKPNRLKINLDFGADKIAFDKRTLSPNMSVNWLTGIKGNNLKVETSVSYRPVKTTFDGLANFKFDDPVKNVIREKKIAFTGRTDASGSTTFNYTLPKQKEAGGAVRATFETKAFEPGGDFSINTQSLIYYPFESFVGLQLPEGDNWGRLQRDVNHKVNIASVDSEGNPIASKRIKMKIYEVNWRWWWDESEDNSVNYIRSSNRNLVTEKWVDITNGRGVGTFNIDNWGRYLMVLEDPISGHTSGDYFYMSWRGGEQGELGATFMSVSTNKTAFEVGEEIELTIPGTSGAQALVSIESGSKVLDHFWTKTADGNTTVKVKATAEMAPNIYAHVTLLQPHAQTKNDLPIRLYGIAPIKVVDNETILEPEIAMNDELAPGKEVTIKVSEKNGKAMAYTIAVVDEGLLDITNFKTPDAWNHFYSREAIGVKTWDLYDEVIGAYGGRLEKVLTVGGDGEGADGEKGKKPDERFKPVVQFMGPFFTTGKAQSHTFTMPQYIGSVKTMVVAGMNGAYGKADKATPVIKPLMVLGTLPRVTGPGEKIKLPVNVFRYKENIKSTTITIETEGLLSISGNKSVSVDLSTSENVIQYFDLEVAKRLGSGKVKITAKSGKEVATHEIYLESRAPNAEQTQVELFTLEKGKTYKAELATFGMEGTNTATLEIATVPSLNLEKRLQYLIRYPHGCIEQTVSAIFPQLFLGDITELTTTQKIRIEQNVKSAIERLKKFQAIEGGLAYWPGQSEVNDWGTNYGYHFLLEAEAKGYFVPKELMNSIKKYQSRRAKNWSKGDTRYNDDLIQAYRLFTLALSGNASLSSMNRMLNTPNLKSQSLWKLGAAYSLIGKKQIALDLLKKAGTQPSRYNYWYSYGSSMRDKALLLESYTYLAQKEEGFKLLRELADNLASKNWYSTQTTAYTLLAISKYLGQMAASDLTAKVTYAGKSENWESELPIIRSSINAESKDKKLSISNEGDGMLFITLTTTGTPYPGEEPATSSGLKMNINYFNQRGESVSVTDIKQGQTFTAEVKIANESTSAVRDVALTQIFPSGWEINNDRLNDTDAFSNSRFDYQDIKDDRIYTYFFLKRGESKTFKVNLTATYGGEFYLPGPYCEAMYDASINAKGKGQWIIVE